MSELDEESASISTMSETLQLTILINNELIRTIEYLGKVNAQLCSMISNINNCKFVVNIKIDELQNKI